ncbi:MAG TPA: M20/M25/M40 family metallo-hydrolase [Myxococcales bacterium]|nr:M20/M25/M40 family metallo-hydrolase [Myxococcales bacterium]
MTDFSRRTVLRGAFAGAASLAMPSFARDDLAPIYDQIGKRHDEAVKRIQTWIHQPTIAAESIGNDEGAQMMIDLLRDAGFQSAVKVPTEGKPGVFATCDAGATKTLGLYFMFDVKQVDPKEWTSPPWEARLVDKPGLGKVIVGRGAVNQKGPEGAFLAALHAIRGAGRKLPVNLVLVAEGEEEIGSPHFPQIVRRPEIMEALKKTQGIWMPFAAQGLDGSVSVNLGAKGVIECEMIASGEKWGRGPAKDIHSSLRASVDSPSFHLVQALNSLVTPDGVDPAIDGWYERVKPLSAAEEKMIDLAAKHEREEIMKKQLGVQHWVRDISFREAEQRLAGKPTVNIEGLVGGYTGTGGKTVLPHKAVAKMDFRLVPDQTVDDCLKKLRAHLDKRGFKDIEVNMSGGYGPNTTSPDAPLIRAEVATYRKHGIDPLLWPRLGGSWPGYVFTEAPLKLAAGHFGLGHGSGAHAPDEYYLIESANPKIAGLDGAVKSFVDYLYELAV